MFSSLNERYIARCAGYLLLTTISQLYTRVNYLVNSDFCMSDTLIMENLPIKAARDLGKKYDLDRVLIIATSTKHDRTYTVSWGKTKEDCGFAAMDIQKLRAVIKEQPTSLADAVEVAKRVRPTDVEGIGG